MSKTKAQDTAMEAIYAAAASNEQLAKEKVEQAKAEAGAAKEPEPKPEQTKAKAPRKRKARSTSKQSAQAPAGSNKRPGKAAKDKATRKTTPRAGKTLYADDAVIRVLATENPKRAGSRAAKEWELYRDGMTVRDYLQAGGSRAGIKWDADREFIRVESPHKR